MSRIGQRQCSGLSVYRPPLPGKIAFRRFLFLIVRGEAARQRVAKRRELQTVSTVLVGYLKNGPLEPGSLIWGKGHGRALTKL